MRSCWLPLALLGVYALAFAWRALGGGLLVVDDHPGQLYRLAHAVELGPWPWRINTGWWAGYAELQYYPPGFAYAGAALRALSLGAASVEAVYGVLLWVVYLLPGLTTWLLLARVLPSPWLALPGAFVALTVSAGSRSGVEEGLRWGLVSARLGWALLPLLAFALERGRQRSQPPIAAAVVLAAIILTHPAHAPAGLVLVALDAWWRPGAAGARARRAVVVTALAAGLAAFWLVPLLAHLDMALPLAWGDASLSALARQLASRPLLLLLAAATALGCWRAWRGAVSRGPWLLAFAPVMAAVVALDAVLGPATGLLWLPADRLFDGLVLALILSGSVALGDLWPQRPRVPDWAAGLAAVGIALVLAPAGVPESTLTLWPRERETRWTKWAELAAGTRIDALWEALRSAPPGRILFVQSGVPIAYRPEWWRPHSHITALAPLYAGRPIVSGTFTHPSPVAGYVYTGSATSPITELAEQRDGRALFGRPLDLLTPEEFDRAARRLRVSGVVALAEDSGRLDFVRDGGEFTGARRVGPFLVWRARAERPLPTPAGAQRWRVPVSAPDGGWSATGLAYSPLWRARAGGRALATRRDDMGLLEVEVPSPPPAEIELVHRPGPAEWAGAIASALTALAMAGMAWRRRAPRSPRSAQTSGS